MTIVANSGADAFVKRAPREMIFFLVHGNDEGLIRERARGIVNALLDGDADPLRLIRFDGDALAREPGSLAEEADAISMFGGSRVIWIELQARVIPAFHYALAPGGFLLPYHHPAELANRVAMLDHMAQGRLNFGVAASGLPSDWAMFNVDGNAGQHREMTREALEIILKLWTEEEFDYRGKYWTVQKDAHLSPPLVQRIN